ncbi:hypothetical protein ACFE04_004143 [Oxalis oulophora]
MSTVRRIKLGSQGLEVSAQGLGCMGMSAFYGPPKPEKDMIDVIHYAVNSGITLLDTSDIYGPHTNEILLGKVTELGIGIVAYSPLGRGFLSSGPKLVETMSDEDYRKTLPRFQAENLEHNQKMYDRVQEIAAKKACTPSQLALAWVHHQGDDVCPIPGTTKIENLNQNIGALSVKLTSEEISELEAIASDGAVKGGRYPSGFASFYDSETPPFSSWKAE